MVTKNLNELKETVALAHRVLFVTGLTFASGHASARIPGSNQFVIKPWPHKHQNRHTAEEMIIMDLDGNKLTGPDTVARVSEWRIHAEIYRARPDVNGVVHTHQKWATMMGIAGKTILPVLHPGIASVAAEPLPVYDEEYATIHNSFQGLRVAMTLGNALGVHLRDHGMVFAAPNLQTAVIDAIHTEYQAELTWLAMQIGAPETVPMLFMRPAIERRGPDNVPDAWENFYKWADQHPESARERVVHV